MLRTMNGLFPSDRLWRLRSLLCNGHSVKLPRHEVNHSPPSSTEDKNEWSYTLLSLYAFMAWTETTSPSQVPTSLSLQCRGLIYCLFNDSVSISDYTVANGNMISEQWIGGDVKGVGRGLLLAFVTLFSQRRANLRSSTQDLAWVLELTTRCAASGGTRTCNGIFWFVDLDHEQYASQTDNIEI
jgi:hypothetical protein